MKFLFVTVYLSIFCVGLSAQSADIWQEQSYALSPIDNPLKGLVPYSTSSNRDSFPHSMEFSYFSLASIVKGPKQYDWRILESFLNEVAGRGHQAVFRFYLEYPGKVGSIPAYFIESGVGTARWQRAGSQGRPPADVETPDYNHSLLRQALIDFIVAMGQRYDGDPRIGFITAGLLGLWGEWHDYPRTDLFASKTVQQSVMDAYAESFRQTPILLRYPAGDNDPVYVTSAKMSFGYHDDSFSWNTLATRDSFFLSKMQRAGPAALAKWQTHPIGGEIRPEAWGKVFDQKPDNPAIEDFLTCVQATHVSWLMDSGMFRKDNPPERIVRALALVGKMGYEFHVPRVALTSFEKKLFVRLQIENRGVAPFYYMWPLHYGVMDERGNLVREITGADSLKGIQPQAVPLSIEQTVDMIDLPQGVYRVLVKVPNSLPNGAPVRFANTLQDADARGWLTLGTVKF